MKSQLQSLRIQSNLDTFQETDLLQANINNYGDEIRVKFNGLWRPIPPPGDVDGTPVPYTFVIKESGREFDLSMEFDFQGNEGNVIVDFSKAKP